MIKGLDKPAYNAGEVYRLCTSKIKKRENRPRFDDCADAIEAAEEEYDQRAAEATLYEILPAELVNGDLTVAEMRSVYARMVGAKSPGRKVYDSLLTSVGICPYCGVRAVGELDHVLHQEQFPSLIVCPWNLVPVCKICNFAKLAKRTMSAEDQLIHPYYDDIEEDKWLFGDVQQTDPVSVTFRVNGPVYWHNVLQARLRNHFEIFGLNALYSGNAASAMSGWRRHFRNLHAHAGAGEVRAFCNDAAMSFQESNLNGWDTVMFETLAASDWFVNEGCLL